MESQEIKFPSKWGYKRGCSEVILMTIRPNGQSMYLGCMKTDYPGTIMYIGRTHKRRILLIYPTWMEKEKKKHYCKETTVHIYF